MIAVRYPLLLLSGPPLDASCASPMSSVVAAFGSRILHDRIVLVDVLPEKFKTHKTFLLRFHRLCTKNGSRLLLRFLRQNEVIRSVFRSCANSFRSTRSSYDFRYCWKNARNETTAGEVIAGISTGVCPFSLPCFLYSCIH